MDIPMELKQLILTVWAGFYSLIVSFIAVQFVYRYICLFYEGQSKMFDGVYSIIWITYPMIPASIYCSTFYLFCLPDDYADEYLKRETFKIYSLDVTQLPRFLIVPYNSDGHLRVKNISLVVADMFSISFHYCIMLYCGLKMHFNMKKELKRFSVPQRRLQRQFFHALVFQSLGPTLFLILPASPILLCPILSPLVDFKMSWQSGWMYSLVGIYPVFDSIALMVIVTEYRKIIKSQLKLLVVSEHPGISLTESSSQSNDVRSNQITN